MKLKRLTGGLLLAPATALLMAAMPNPAVADPASSGRGVGVGGCPPGLQSKGCMPPGQQKGVYRGDDFRDHDLRDYRRDDFRDYRRGDRIPDFEPFDPFYYREYGLPDPGPGRRYVRIGDQVYLVSEDTHRILEAIRLFGALAQ